MIRAIRLALPALLAASPCLAQYANSYSGSYLGQPAYSNPTLNRGYGTNPYGTTGYGATGYGNNAYGNAGYGNAGYGVQNQGYGTQNTLQQQNLQQTPQNASTGRIDDVLTNGRAGSAKTPVKEQSAPAATTQSQARPDPRGRSIYGTAKVVDGKSLLIGADLVVLNGADAPASDQTCTDSNGMVWECGRKAMDRLVQLTQDQTVFCTGVSNGTNGIAATCRVGTTDLGKTMVQDGLALSPKAVAPVYLGDESQARLAHRGMWVGTFKTPWEARAGK